MNSIILQNLTPQDLEDLIIKVVQQCLASNRPITNKQNDYLSRNEVAALLKISLPTLNSWCKAGIIKSSRIGSRRLFKKSDIESALKEVKYSPKINTL